jgi:hypothetical protein
MGAGTPASTFLFLDNMVRAAELLDDAERGDIAEDVKVREREKEREGERGRKRKRERGEREGTRERER